MKHIETIVLPDNVTRIGELAFGECSSLKNINIPNSFHAIWNCYTF